MTIASQYVRGVKVVELVKRAVSGIPIILPEAETVTPQIQTVGRVVTPSSKTVQITSYYTTKVT